MAITPSEDGTIVKLVEYLKQHLNTAAANYYTSQAEQVQIAVEGLEVGRTDLAGLRKFPLLMGYRSQMTGPELEECSAVLRYFVLASVQTHRGQDAWFTWVAKQIAIALETYEHTDKPCLDKVRVIRATLNYAEIERQGKRLNIPFLQVDFSFRDLELVI